MLDVVSLINKSFFILVDFRYKNWMKIHKRYFFPNLYKSNITSRFSRCNRIRKSIHYSKTSCVHLPKVKALWINFFSQTGELTREALVVDFTNKKREWWKTITRFFIGSFEGKSTVRSRSLVGWRDNGFATISLRLFGNYNSTTLSLYPYV